MTLLSKILEERGVSPFDLLEKRTAPYWDRVSDMASVLTSCLLTSRKIGIVYDCDVDGLLSGYILADYLERIGVTPLAFMNKNKEHGLTDGVKQWVESNQIDFVVFVDAGSGDDFICLDAQVFVIDHHEYDKGDCAYVLNIEDHPTYPKLPGCGVVYAVLEEMDKTFQLGVSQYECFVGVTVLSDVCSMLVPDNRYFVKQAFLAVDDQHPFFMAFPFYGSKHSLIAYSIVPFFNAMIRLNLTGEVLELARYFNSPRLKFELQKYKNVKIRQKTQVEELLAVSKQIVRKGLTILVREKTEGLAQFNGLVANKVIQMFNQSALVLEVDKEREKVTGSFRGLNFGNEVLSELGVECSGHNKACGVSMSIDCFKRLAGSFHYEGEMAKVGYDVEVDTNRVSLNDWLSLADFNEMSGKDCDKIQVKLIDKPISSELIHKRKCWNFSGASVIDFSGDNSDLFLAEPLRDKESFQLLRVSP